MSWRGRDDRSRWGEHDTRWAERPRSPAWDQRRSPGPGHSPQQERRDRYDRDRRYERDRDRRDRHDRDADRSRNREQRYDRSRERDRDRDRDRDRRRSPRRDERDVPPPPSPPTISFSAAPERKSVSRSRSRSRDRHDEYEKHDRDRDRDRDRQQEDSQQSLNASPGDWICKCGSYNFKRRNICYRRMCQGKRSEGVVYGGDDRSGSEGGSGITKRLLFRRLDALTTEEKILEAIKERCSKSVLDSIAGITIGRETLTGASKCLAYINFNSIADSTAAHTELMALNPPLEIDNRDVLISFYNEPQKIPKNLPTMTDYSAYYTQMQSYNTAAQALSEADRVNAAAAVAQSAISAAQARSLTWPSTSATTPTSIPTGDSKTIYTAPDVRTFMYDETSGYYYDPATGLYYDANTQYFYNSQINQYMYWDATSCTYIAATSAQAKQNNDQSNLPKAPQPTVENTIPKEPEEKKKKEKEDKVKVAKKIAKDMERWARTLNQKKENARSNVVMEQPLDVGSSKGSADIGFTVLGAGPAIPQSHVREISPPPIGDDFLIKKTQPETISIETDEGIIDWSKLTCLLCKRRFPSADVLNKHKTLSDLHKQNLIEHRKKEELLPQTNGYRDRAAERRMKFGEDEPIMRKRYDPPEVMSSPLPPSAPPPSVVDTIGGKMLQKMGWSEGRGLGKTEQGRIAPIEAEQRPALVGLGQKRGIYTPTPGETYRDTVKKLMIARYKEVVGQEDGK